MGTQKLERTLLFGLFAVFLLAGFASAEKKVSVIGSIQCSDCSDKSIKSEDAFKGLRVAIKCKSALGQYETKGVSQFDKSGNFHINLAELKPECLAELRDETNKPCPKSNPLALTLAKDQQNVYTIANEGKMQLSSSICSSKTFVPPCKCDPLKFFPWKKKPEAHVPKYKPPTPEYKPTPIPVYTPTPVPEYKPTPNPVYTPTPVPEYKPTPNPVYTPTPVPEYKPTPNPVYTPTPNPEYKPTPSPVYKPTPAPTTTYAPKFPFPTIYKHPFFKKKPFCPPAKNEKKN